MSYLTDLVERNQALKAELATPPKVFTLDRHFNFKNFGQYTVLNTDEIHPPIGAVGAPVDLLNTFLRLTARADFWCFAITGVLWYENPPATWTITWNLPLYVRVFNQADNVWLSQHWLHWDHFAGGDDGGLVYLNVLPIPKPFSSQTSINVQFRSEFAFAATDIVQIALLGVERAVEF